jgi:16S rRNA G1207 methylase RsmC
LNCTEFQFENAIELGSGTGWVGISVARLFKSIVLTDRNELALELCKHNSAINSIENAKVEFLTWGKNVEISADFVFGSELT